MNSTATLIAAVPGDSEHSSTIEPNETATQPVVLERSLIQIEQKLDYLLSVLTVAAAKHKIIRNILEEATRQWRN